jgi:hypothetical protein
VHVGERVRSAGCGCDEIRLETCSRSIIVGFPNAVECAKKFTTVVK